jgi:hypothetical protein
MVVLDDGELGGCRSISDPPHDGLQNLDGHGMPLPFLRLSVAYL